MARSSSATCFPGGEEDLIQGIGSSIQELYSSRLASDFTSIFQIRKEGPEEMTRTY